MVLYVPLILNNKIMYILSIVVAIVIATTMFLLRKKSTQSELTLKKIVLPPLFMSTGSFMFVFPPFQVQIKTVIIALLVGCFFSTFLIMTTKFQVIENKIYVIPSTLFIICLFGLIIVRTVIKLLIGDTISVGEMTSVFFLVALGMILCWRMSMLIQYIQIKFSLNRFYNK